MNDIARKTIFERMNDIQNQTEQDEIDMMNDLAEEFSLLTTNPRSCMIEMESDDETESESPVPNYFDMMNEYDDSASETSSIKMFDDMIYDDLVHFVACCIANRQKMFTFNQVQTHMFCHVNDDALFNAIAMLGIPRKFNGRNAVFFIPEEHFTNKREFDETSIPDENPTSRKTGIVNDVDDNLVDILDFDIDFFLEFSTQNQ